MKIHHIGYLVRKIDKAKAAFIELGYEIKRDTVFDDYRQINICFLEKDGYVVELVSPVSKESVVYDMLKKIGNSPYHICYTTSNFDDDVQQLLDKRYIMCCEKHEAIAIDGKQVCFMIHPYLGMIELVEV